MCMASSYRQRKHCELCHAQSIFQYLQHHFGSTPWSRTETAQKRFRGLPIQKRFQTMERHSRQRPRNVLHSIISHDNIHWHFWTWFLIKVVGFSSAQLKVIGQGYCGGTYVYKGHPEVIPPLLCVNGWHRRAHFLVSVCQVEEDDVVPWENLVLDCFDNLHGSACSWLSTPLQGALSFDRRIDESGVWLVFPHLETGK